MTREEAKEILQEQIDKYGQEYDAEGIEALKVAIEVLEQEPKPMEKFESTKDHIFKLAGDYKCWDNRLTWEEALELCHILEQEPKTEWIPVSEKLPDTETRCLICTQNGYIGIDKYGEHRGNINLPRKYNYTGWGTSNAEPIAWLPLPEPYEESEVEG